MTLSPAEGREAIRLSRAESLAEDQRDLLQEKCAARATAILREAQSAGYFKDPAALKQLQEDPHLEALRDREYFKKLAKEIGAD